MPFSDVWGFGSLFNWLRRVQNSHVNFADDLVLFAEASTNQTYIINDCLEEFCISSGQKVSRAKSKVFVSKNASRGLAQVISGNLVSS